MKPGIPWSVKGIDAEAREAAKFAARRSGMTLGEWLNSVILESAEEADDLEHRYTRRRPLPAAARPAGRVDDLRARLDHLSEQLAVMASRDQETAASRYLARSIQDPEADPALKSVLRRLQSNEIGVTEAIRDVHQRLDDLAHRLDDRQRPAADERIDGIMERIEESEAQTAQRFDQLDARFDVLDRKIAEAADPRIDEVVARLALSEQHTSQAIDRMGQEVGRLGREIAQHPASAPYERPEDVPGFTSLESALRNVVDHIEESERRTRETLKTLSERMAETQQLAETARAGAGRDRSPGLERLERQLAQLAERIESQETRAHTAVKGLVEERFSRLTEQVSAVRHGADSLVEKAETAASRTAERQVRDAEQRLRTMIAEATARAARSEGNGEFGRMRAEIDVLGRKLETVQGEAATREDVRSLQSALEEVATSIGQGPDAASIADLERRIAELSSELAARMDRDEAHHHLTALAQRLDEFDSALREATGPAASAEAITALDQHIAAVDQRLSATEEQLGHLATIERSIAQLFETVEQNRSSVEEIAEATARRVVDEMALRGAPAPGEEAVSAIQALEQGLAAVKASAETADQRNQETLEAVHETLEQIITKLGELESWHTATAVTLARFEADAREEAGFDVPAEVEDGAAEASATADWIEESDDTPTTAWQSVMSDFADDGPPAEEDVADHAMAMPADTTPTGMDDGSGQPAGGESSDHLMAALPAEMEIDEPETAEAQAPDAATEADAAPTAVREDFIAAARRAAQSAAPRSSLSGMSGLNPFSRHKPAGSNPAAASAAPAAARKSRQPFSFLKGKGNPAATPDDAATRRKRLILVGAVLLAAAAAYGLNAQRALQPPASEPQKVGDLAPDAQTAETETAAERSAVVAAEETVKEAEATRLDNGLAERTGMAPQEVLEPTADTLTTASLAPLPAPRRAGEQSTIETHLAALVSGNSADKGERTSTSLTSGPRNDEAALAEAIGPAPLRAAAAAGDARAQFVVATRYLEGKAVPQDAAAAARWYQKAAAQGLASAQYRLGTLFERGLGVPADPVAARMWYERGAEAGNVKAMHNLAVILADNQAGNADYARAVRWFAAAAGHGVKDSQFNLAVLNERGLGTLANRPVAFRWYLLAARQGDGDAEARAKTLREHIPAGQIATIEAEVAAWQPRAVDRDANFVSIEDPSWNAAASEEVEALPPSPELTGSKLVARTQELLARLGYDIGTADGVMGARTANAIRLFQMQSGMTVNGMASNDLLRHLMAKAG